MTMQKVEAALERIANQRLTDEMEGHEILSADFEGAYDKIVADGRAALALLRSDAQGERGGWRLVPVEPTEAMLHASTMEVPTWDRDSSLRKWRAMLAAAPSTPSPSEIATPALPSESKDSGVTARRDGTPSPSDWEAGAIRGRILKCADQGIISWNAAQEVANRVLSLPIPRRP